MHFSLFPQNFSLSNAPAARCWYLCWQCAENLHGTRCVTGWSISVLWTWVWWVLKTVRKTEAKMYHHCLRQTQQPKRIHTSRRSLSLCMLYTFGPSPMLGGWNLAKAAMLVKFLPTGQPHRYPALGDFDRPWCCIPWCPLAQNWGPTRTNRFYGQAWARAIFINGSNTPRKLNRRNMLKDWLTTNGTPPFFQMLMF